MSNQSDSRSRFRADLKAVRLREGLGDGADGLVEPTTWSAGLASCHSRSPHRVGIAAKPREGESEASGVVLISQ